MAKEKYDEKDGVWRTVGGRKIFIRNGQSLADAMIESGKFKGQKNKPGIRESYREGIDEIKEERKEAKSEEQRLKRERDSLANAYSNNRYGYGTDYWGKQWNDARKMTNEQTKEVANYDAMLDKEGQKASKERQKEFDKEHGKAYPYREQYKQENKELLEEEKDWKNYRDRQQKSLNRSTNPESQDRFRSERDASQKILDKTREKLNQKADEILGNKSTKDPYDDPESEESQRLQDIQSRYDEYLQYKEGRGASYGEIAYIDNLRGKDLDDFEKDLDKYEERVNKQKEEDKRIKAQLDRERKIDNKSTNNKKSVDDYLNRDKTKDKLNYNENTKEDTLHGGTFQKKNESSRNQEEAKKYGYSENEWNKFQKMPMTDYERANFHNEEDLKRYQDTKKDILEYYTEDYGWENISPEEAFVKQMNAVKYNDRETLYQQGARLAEGGNYLIANEDMKNYLKEKGINVADDNAFEKYKDYMGQYQSAMYQEFTDPNYKSTNETMNDAIREKANRRKINYQKNYSKDGSVMSQNVTINSDERNKINEAIRKEKEAGYPNYKNYANDQNSARMYLEEIGEDNYKDTNNTTNRFIKNYLGEDRIKTDRNTRYLIKDEKSTNSTMNSKIRGSVALKNEFKQYKKDHPGSKMKFDEFKKKKK